MSITNTEISNRFNEIESILIDSKKWAVTNPLLASQLATFLDVYLLGVVEESFEFLIKRRANKAKDPEVYNYISQDIEHTFRNPCRKNILGALNKFSTNYGDAFAKKFPIKCSEIDALDAILSHKTNLAHKGAFNLGLSLEDVEQYLSGIIIIFENLEQILA